MLVKRPEDTENASREGDPPMFEYLKIPAYEELMRTRDERFRRMRETRMRAERHLEEAKRLRASLRR
jgi:hypothetical protein